MSKLRIVGFLSVLSSALAISAWDLAWGQPATVTPKHSQDELSGLMRAKLASSQKVVEGLMANEFALIRKGAEEMRTICDATEWHASDDQVYAHYRSELRRTAKKLIMLADEKNLDGASYTYMHSLTTCITCHEYCRDVLHIAAQSPKLQPVPSPGTSRHKAAGESTTHEPASSLR